jgi:hypothetical protein
MTMVYATLNTSLESMTNLHILSFPRMKDKKKQAAMKILAKIECVKSLPLDGESKTNKDN